MASIERKKNGSIKIVVSSGYDAKGKQIRHSHTIEAAELSSLTERQREKEIERQKVLFEQKVKNGTFLDGEKIAFGEFAEKWLTDYAEKQLAPKTVFEYKKQLSGRVLPAIGHTKIAKLQPTHLLEFYNNLAENGMRMDYKYQLKTELIDMLGSEKKSIIDINSSTMKSILKGKFTTIAIAEKISAYFNMPLIKMFNAMGTEKKLSNNTIAHYHRLISTILTVAVQWQIIPTNPCERVKPPKIEKKEAGHYDDEQASKMFELLESAPLKYQVAVYIAIFGGLRLGEVVALEWSDINFDAGTLKINKAAQYIPGIGSFEKDPKTVNGTREIMLPQIALKKLSEHKKAQNEDRLKCGQLWQDHNKIFTQAFGKPIFHDTISKWFSKWLKEESLDYLKFHGLRHSNASLMIAQGVDIATVSKRLGHGSIAITTSVYTHAIDRMDKEAAGRLDDMFSSKPNNQGAKLV